MHVHTHCVALSQQHVVDSRLARVFPSEHTFNLPDSRKKCFGSL